MKTRQERGNKKAEHVRRERYGAGRGGGGGEK